MIPKRFLETTRIKPAIRSNQPSREIPLKQIINPKETDFNGQGMVTLSYDDGRVNNFELALPLHEKYGVPATFNVIASRFDHPLFINKSITHECHRRGVEIASHSYYHSGWLIDKTEEEIHFEFGESQRILEDIIQDTVDTFAVPFSRYDERVKAIGMQYYKGIRSFGSIQNSIPPQDRYWIYSALAIEQTTTFADIKEKIDEAIANNEWCVIMLHGVKPTPEDIYDITPTLLEQVLAYITSFDRNVLLPVNTRDALKFSLGDQY